MMSALIPKTRKVTYLHCQADIAHNLDAAELTELMYVLSKLFNMRHQNANRFVIEIDRFPEHDAEIALLNGLGFSHIGMRFNAPGEQLEHYVSLARSYGMRIIFDLDTLTADTDCHKKLSLLLNQGVDAFCYRSDSQASKEMLPALEQAGIHSASPMFSCPPAFQEPRAPDILGLGMGALTVIGNCIAYNADQIDQYYQQIELHKLPLQHAGYARTLRQHS